MTTGYRHTFFTKMHTVAEARTFNFQEADTLFLSLFEMHRESAEGVITMENLTDEEKSITHNYLPSFMYNTGSCYMPFSVVSKRYELELLSGLVVFRLEVLPVLAQFVEHDILVSDIFKVAPVIIFNISVKDFCHKEQSLLRGFKHNDKYYVAETKIDLGSHALHKHPWWHGKYETASPKEIVLNYKLDDDYPYIWPEMPS